MPIAAQAASVALNASAGMKAKMAESASDVDVAGGESQTAWDDMANANSDENRRLRARKLTALADKELTTSNLRALFRLLDDDGSHEISAAEIQRGLLLLGFKNATDPVALSRLLLDIDEDRTGSVSENEFLSFMSTVDRTTLKAKIDSYVIDRAYIIATFYGSSGGVASMRTELVDATKLREWLLALSQKGPYGRLWLDITGYSESAHTVLAEALGLTPKEVATAVLFQSPKLEVVHGPLGDRAEIIVHGMSLSSNPLADVGRPLVKRVCCPCGVRTVHVLCGGDDEHESLLSNKQLVSKSAIVEQPPAISLEQVTMLIVDDRTIITMRAPVFEGGSDAETFKHPGASPEEDTLNNDPSNVRSIFEEVRKQMKGGAPEYRHLFSGTTKALAVALVDAVLQHNYTLRDSLQDWEEVLAKDINKQPVGKHTPHLDALQRLTSTFAHALGPLTDAFNPDKWSEEEDLERAKEAQEALTAGAAAPEGASSVEFPNAAAASEALADVTDSAGGASKEPPMLSKLASLRFGSAMRVTGDGPSDAPPSSRSEGPSTRKNFFKAHIGEFTELAMDLNSMMDDMMSKKEVVENLAKLLASLKADQMNRTLYSLTLITALSVPITFLTGLWGMNFGDMPELVSPEEGGEFGYKTFWIALSSVVGTVLLLFWRLNMFSGLSS